MTAQQPKHCEHECVCEDYHIVMDEEDPKHCNIAKCQYDTRTRPNTPAPSFEHHRECFGTFEKVWEQCRTCSLKEPCKERQAEATHTATLAAYDKARVRLSKLKTAYPTGADFVWWLVIDTVFDELRQQAGERE
jgi:hypothetical protein